MNKHNIFLSLIVATIIIGCEKTNYTINDEHGPKISDIVVFEQISYIELVADSASNTEFVVALNKLADSTFLSIQVSTDRGFFSNGSQTITLEANSDRKASFTLLSSLEEGIAHIRATVNTVSIDTTVTFVKALPDFILISPSLFSTNGKIANLGLTLGRYSGKVGHNILIALNYKSLDTTGVLLDIPPYLDIVDRTDSVAISNPLQIKGRFEIRAQVLNQQLDTVSSVATVVFE